MLTPTYFTQNPAVQSALAGLHLYVAGQKGWRISDVGGGANSTAASGQEYPLQYVDLVMEGGGMLGIALVGYVYALEQVGIRFLGLGGTSAGSINALLMAAAAPREQASTDWLIEQLANQNFYDFVDGDSDARDFTADLLRPTEEKRGLWGWVRRAVGKTTLINDGLQIIDNLRDDYGLHPGDKFKEWITKLLAERDITTIAQLRARRAQPPTGGLRRTHNEQNAPVNQPYAPANLDRIAIVAADITTQTKAVFPEMAHLYWSQPDEVHPAELVRASMSIPLFFQPYRRTPLPGSDPADPATNQRYRAAWVELGYTGEIPREAMFMDGGIMSNFPIDLFHDNTRVPAAPTFGVKLGIDRGAPSNTSSLPAVLGAMFDAARTQYDFDFIHRNSDYRHLVHCLNVDKFNWLDFRMSDERKVELFAVGVRGAVEFLKSFDWEAYKKLRAAKVQVVQQSRAMDGGTV
ncbi:MAG TPA: patatin-like phospholipase family protein [Hymenobacter sp.]|uniref:patatin-like phospholipase family protein n=1 Tax=Hymenobacter sp. TaxID=1898978 RepID=UPI002D7E2E37|nr:patatin-like phospholipase family protein [Hymenobacter sp.]HET9502130.1 patatin-like phospholipase family protein [Hymenobacter sp.]